MKRFVLSALAFSMVGLALVPSSFATPPRPVYDCPDPNYNSGDDDSPNKNLTAQPVTAPSLGSNPIREADREPSAYKTIQHTFLSLRERLAFAVATVRDRMLQ